MKLSLILKLKRRKKKTIILTSGIISFFFFLLFLLLHFQIDENVAREIINHRSLRHPNIIRFKEVGVLFVHLLDQFVLSQVLIDSELLTVTWMGFWLVRWFWPLLI